MFNINRMAPQATWTNTISLLCAICRVLWNNSQDLWIYNTIECFVCSSNVIYTVVVVKVRSISTRAIVTWDTILFINELNILFA